eukprot:TRINITY_DN3120_c0_g1_i3.p1 TRINITY_DN3120_c0_g1~~TRINITY_DN3120_c0_g1_i3.p1  ORF type:complete len:128 (+),score=33.70 TRINITY_DN3120_c0_g1_i3:35-385(+)
MTADEEMKILVGEIMESDEISSPPTTTTTISASPPTRGRKRKYEPSPDEPELQELETKLQKLSHDIHKIDSARCVHVKFAPNVILKAKKHLQEPWGIMISSMEDYEDLDIKIGQKF